MSTNALAGERIDAPEVALAAFRIDPSPDSREAAYSLGYLWGHLAGEQYAVAGALSTEFADQHARAYAHHSNQFLPAMSFAVALVSRSKWRDGNWDRGGMFTVEALRIIGWVRGWADATEDCDHAVTCADSNCGRRLVLDDDDVWTCRLDQSQWCGWHSSDVCRGGAHERECWD